MAVWIAGGIAAAAVVWGLVAWMRRVQERRRLDAFMLEAEMVYELLHPEARVLIYDVRQPLDLLAHSEIIPGAVRISPKEAEANPDLLPRDQDMVIYCTCPGDKTSRAILQNYEAWR